MRRTATATSLTGEARATGTPDSSPVAVAEIRSSPARTGMDRHGITCRASGSILVYIFRSPSRSLLQRGIRHLERKEIMLKLRMAAIATLFILLAAPTAHSDFIDILDTWYSDGTFDTVVGSHEKDCDGYIFDSGSQSDWHARLVTGCSSGNQVIACSHWNGSSWDDVSCEWIDSRIHIPIP